MSEVACVIFDLGRTLIPFNLESLEARLEAPGAKMAAQRLFRQFETGWLRAEEFEAAICVLTRLRRAEFAPWWNSIFERRWLIPEPWVRALLARFRCGLLSNTNVLHFEFLAAEQPLLREFAFRVLSHEVGAVKPEARIYEAAEAAAGCAPEAILYFDDVPGFVAAARARGWQAHTFTGAGALTDHLSSYGLQLNGGRRPRARS
ncbi:MAG: HAD-IA family hydrolase [Terriglobales bacterium]